MQHSCYHTVVLSALTTGGHTFIWVGREEECVIWAVATLHLYICHGTELIDGINEFLVVPAETTSYCVKAQLVVVCESKHKLMKKTDWLWWATTMCWWIVVPGITGSLHQRATGSIHFGTWTSIFYEERINIVFFSRGHCCDVVGKLWNYEFVTVLYVEHYYIILVAYHRVHWWHSSSQYTLQPQHRHQHRFVSWCRQCD